ncbi:hypothetical protein AVEN_158712-1 [Araneus ventricosus]|uniref:Uncharacterized protein n=1 Tax=Araneus ventricosus TaxID=182803 RepID=A0A4Y2HV79_ARAVE|nr:hypothetical protein AVEN_158712-1 [Araneus ventricosus]
MLQNWKTALIGTLRFSLAIAGCTAERTSRKKVEISTSRTREQLGPEFDKCLDKMKKPISNWHFFVLSEDANLPGIGVPIKQVITTKPPFKIDIYNEDIVPTIWER